MEHLHKLSLEELIDILSTQTSLYIQMQSEGVSEIEFENCKFLIRAAQEEINSRKKTKSPLPVPPNGI